MDRKAAREENPKAPLIHRKTNVVDQEADNVEMPEQRREEKRSLTSLVR
jgi:hypothetical protein